MTEVTFTKNSDDTSILTVKLDGISSKSMKALSNVPEDWVENIISSRCQPMCENLWQEHVKTCLRDNVTPKVSKTMLLLGYDPPSELIFQPKGSCIDIDDGSCVIEVTIDPLFTKCIQDVFTDPSKEIKSIICTRVEMQIEVMIDEAVSKNLHLGKTRDEIIMSYQSEETIVEFSDDEEPFIDTNRTDLQTTRTQLEEDLQTTRTQLGEDLQTEKVKTQQMKEDLQTELEVTKLKLLNTEARLKMVEQTMTSILSKLNV